MKHGLSFRRSRQEAGVIPDSFLPVSEEELWEVVGRGGSSRSSSSSGSSGGYSAQSSLEKGRTDAAIASREVASARALVAAGVPYGSSNITGKVTPANSSSLDCSGAMSSVADRPYQTTAALMNPSTQAACGYVNAVSNSQVGTWTVVTYKDPSSGKIVGHSQMTMPDGQYFDSVPAGGGGRSGPSLTSTPVLSALKAQGVDPGSISVVYLRPTK